MHIYIILIVLAAGILFSGCSGTSPNVGSSTYKKFGYEENLVYKKRLKQPTNKKEPCQMLMEGYSISGENDSAYTVTWDGSCANGKAQGLGKLTSYGMYGSGYEIGYVKNGVSEDYFYTKNLDTKQVAYGKYIRKNGNMYERLINLGTEGRNGKVNNIYYVGKQEDSINIWNGVSLRKSQKGTDKHAGLFGKNIFLGGIDYMKNNQTYGKWLGYTDLNNFKSYSYGRYSDNKGSRYFNLKGGVRQSGNVSQSVLTLATKVETEAYSQVSKAQNAGNIALSMKKKYDSLHRKKIKPKNTVKRKKRKSNSSLGFQQSMQGISF